MSEPSPSTDAIVIEDLVVKFRNKVAVNRLSLRVPRGSVFALLGDNGMGKSTTMRVLTGQIQPYSGRAKIFDRDCWAAADSLRHVLGYVPDRPKMYDWMTVSEIGWFAASFHKPGFQDRYLQWVDKLNLDLGKRLKDFSKGGYARVGLALALAPDPEVLLLDEPTSGLDLHTRREFLSNLVDLAAEGRTILISSHSISELERFVSHVGLVHDGRITQATTLDGIRSRFLRVDFRYEHDAPAMAQFGTVCESSRVGRSMQFTLMDPDRRALAGLQQRADIHDYTESKVGLEDCYAALTRPEKPTEELHSRNGKPSPVLEGAI